MTVAHVRKSLAVFGSRTVFGRSDVQSALGLKPTRISELLREMVGCGAIEPVSRRGKGSTGVGSRKVKTMVVRTESYPSVRMPIFENILLRLCSSNGRYSAMVNPTMSEFTWIHCSTLDSFSIVILPLPLPSPTRSLFAK